MKYIANTVIPMTSGAKIHEWNYPVKVPCIVSFQNQPAKAVAVERKSVPTSVKVAESELLEHLYLVSGEYIQRGGTDPRSAKLEQYVQFHGLDYLNENEMLPPYS